MIENNTFPQPLQTTVRRQPLSWYAAMLLVLAGLVGLAPQSHAQSVLQWWPLKASSLDSAAVRSPNVTANAETLHNFVVSNGTSVSVVKPYTAAYGQAFGSSADGTSSPVPGGTLNRTYYAQVKVTAAASSTVRLDSVIAWAAFYGGGNTANYKLAVAWSLSNFVSDSTEASGGKGPVGVLAPRTNPVVAGSGTGSFADPIVVRNQNATGEEYYRLPLGSTGVSLTAGQTLTIRFYYATGSTSASRYMLLRDVQAKGITGTVSGGCAAPTNAAVGSITSNSAQLTFTPGTGNTTYAVTYTPQGGTTTTITPAPTASPVNLTGLTVGTTYTLTLQSLCGSTASVTTTLSFTTPLAAGASAVLQHYPLKLNAQDSAAIRSAAVTASVATLKRLQLADGSNSTVSQPYSPKFGQAVGVLGTGSWATSSGAPATVANPDRLYYEQYTVTAAVGRSVRVDSLLFTGATYNSANGRLAVVYSLTGFTTADSTNIPTGGRVTPGGTLPSTNYGAFGSPIQLANQTGGPTNVYHLAFSGSTGLTLSAGQTLTVRLYPGVGSTSAGRYVTIKDVVFKGAALGAAPCNAAFAYSGSSYCKTGTNPTPTVTGTSGGTFSSATGLSITANTGAINLAASTAGTYTVTYTVSASCSSTATVTINAAPTAAFSYASTSYCAGSTATPAPAIGTGSTAGTFSSTTGLSITASTGAINLATSTAGTYTVTNTIAAANGCAAVTATFGVTINPATTATFAYGAASYCTSSINPTPTVTGTSGGTFSSTTGLSLTASTGAINLSASTPGTYTVTYAVAGNCPSSSTQTVTITAPGRAAFSYPAAAYCTSATGTVAAALTAGSTAGTFSSTTGLTLNASTGAITPSTSTAGTYTVTNTLAASGGCGAITATATVTINAATTAGFSYANATYCLSGSNPTPTVTGTSGGTFSSTTGLSITASTGAINLAASTAGTYTVTYAVAGPCPSSSTQTVTLSTAPTATFSYPSTAYCVGSSATPTATVAAGSASGVFSSTTGLSIAPSTGAINLAASNAGTYVVTNTVAASSGCAAATATFTITLNPATTATFAYGATSYCTSSSNPTLTVTGTSGGTFSSTTGLSLTTSTGAINLSASTPGTYTVTYSVAGSCPSSSTQTVTITAPGQAAFSYPASAYCTSASAVAATLSTGSTAGTFSSTTGLTLDASTGTITPSTSTAGTYTVTNTLVATGGCGNITATASVTINAATTAGFSYANATYCLSGSNPTPTVSGTSGGTFTSIAGLSITASTGAIDLSASTAGTYTVTYSVAGPCPSSSSQTVTLSTAPTATFSYPNVAYCIGSGSTPMPTAAVGSSTGTFSSTTGLSINAANGAIDLSTSTAGTYTVTNTVAASGSCAAASATTTVTINAATTAGFSYANAAYCQSGTNPTAIVTGTAGGTFSSATGLSLDANTGAVNLTASTAGTYTITYNVAGPCSSSSTQTLTITAPLTAGFIYPAAAYCTSQSSVVMPVLATGSTGGTFSSTTGLTLNAATGEITPGSSTAGTYTVTNTVAASGGCAAATATFSVTVTNAATANFSYTNASYCTAASTSASPVLATGSTAGTFSSTTGLDINAAGAIALGTSLPGTYVVTNTVAASGGCAAVSATFSVTINATPAQPTVSVAYSGTTATLTSSAATGNQWYLGSTAIPGATGQTYVVNSSAQFGSYTVVTTSAAGCASAASAPLVVTASRSALPGTSLSVYPNPTPDGQLTVQLTGYQQAVELNLVNALGQVVLTRHIAQPAGTAATQQLDLHQLATGVYVLRAATAGGVDTRRVMVR